MKYILQCLAFIIFLCSSTIAQTDDSSSFVADRPGSATPPDVMTFRKVQLEDGLLYSNLFNGNIHRENYLFSSLLVRYGFVKYAELRIQTDFAYNITKDSTGKTIVSGFTPITIGMKIKLIGQQKVIPNISLLFNLTLPFVGKQEFVPRNFAPSFYLLMSNDITDRLNLCYNYGMIWNGSTGDPIHFYAACFDIHLHPKWDVFIEGYGFSSLHVSPAFYMDTGAAFLINDHLQADLSVTGYLNSIRDFYMFNMGIAWKIN